MGLMTAGMIPFAVAFAIKVALADASGASRPNMLVLQR